MALKRYEKQWRGPEKNCEGKATQGEAALRVAMALLSTAGSGVVMTSCDKKRKGEEKQLQCEEIHLRLISPTNRKE